MERNTRQREAILKVIRIADRPLGPQEILKLAGRAKRGLGLTTVYRAIRAMVAERLLTPVDVPGKPPRYELAGKGHHHHFHCRNCDRVYDLRGCPGALKRMAPRGFRVQGHEIVLHGLCADCSKK